MAEPSVDIDRKWLDELKGISRTVALTVKALSALPEDPFLAREHVLTAKDNLARLNIDMGAVKSALKVLDEQCTVAHAEFWDRFARVCVENGWTVDGTTTRRLLSKGVFVELTNDKVLVKELALTINAHVPTVTAAVKAEVDSLIPSTFNLEQFGDLLFRAYESLPGNAERPIEAVYRAMVIFLQKPAFWNTQRPTAFTRFSRPAFRARLTALLDSNLQPRGKQLRFGTGGDPAGTWEIFSPGENRCVQVGRLYLY